MTSLGSVNCHLFKSGNSRAGGMSAGFPCGAPVSTHLTIAAISVSVSDTSLLKCWTPTFLSMNHGGISRAATFRLIDAAHGRASAYVSSDIGAMLPGR